METLKSSGILFNEMAFMLASKLKFNTIQSLFDKLMRTGLDENTLGFWVWDIANEIELYSPKFRSSLQFTGELDFPNTPQSWMNQISKNDKELAIENFNKHVETKGEHEYIQTVTYSKKYKGTLDVLCHGRVVKWEGDKPLIMVGVHLSPIGLYQKVINKFQSIVNNNVRFSDMLQFPEGIEVEIEEGIMFEVQFKDEKTFIGVCKMSEGAELAIHHHSDYEETFDIISGEISDLHADFKLKKGETYTYKAMTPHIIFANKDTTIIIKGKKVKHNERSKIQK